MRRWRAQGGRRNTARPLSPRGGIPGENARLTALAILIFKLRQR
jgi:hypothetical protein